MSWRQFDVAIIGGGVAGCATAYFLAQAGRRVCLVEPGVMGGGGASSLTGGIVRAYDPDPVLAALSMRGVQLYNEWEQHGLPGMSPLRRTGFYYLVSDTHAETATKGVQQLTEAGYPVQSLDIQTGVERVPFLQPSHPAQFLLYEPLGGYGNARLTCQQLAFGVQEAGGWVLENSGLEVSLDVSTDGWTIRFARGDVKADVVVVAAGIASIHYVPSLTAFVRSIPLARLQGATVIPIVDECNGTYLVPGGEGVFFAGVKCNRDLHLDEPIPAFADKDLADAQRRVAGVLRPEIAVTALGGISGYDLYSTHLRPQIGFLSDQPGMFVVTAFSGRGYKFCLAVGEAASNAICEALGKKAPYPDACTLGGMAPVISDLATVINN